MADDEGGGPKPERRDQARLIGAVVLVGLVVALALDNSRKVPIGYVIGDAHFRMVYLLLVTAALGFAAGFLAARRRRR